MTDKTTGQKIILTVFFAGLGVLVWIMLPLFLPIYLWLEVDFNKLANQHQSLDGASLEELQKEWTYKVFYNPRGKDDPVPWQIMSDSEDYPAWIDEDEFNMMVRVNFLSAAEGKKPSEFFVTNANDYDRFYLATGFRLPPGSLGLDNNRSIFLYTSREKEGTGMSRVYLDQIRVTRGEFGWINDDDWFEWPDRDDGYRPPDPQLELEQESLEGDADEQTPTDGA